MLSYEHLAKLGQGAFGEVGRCCTRAGPARCVGPRARVHTRTGIALVVHASATARWRTRTRCRSRTSAAHAPRPHARTRAQVALARTVETGEVVALKRIFIRDPAHGLPDNVAREIRCLQSLDHPNVVQLKDVFPKVCVARGWGCVHLPVCMAERARAWHGARARSAAPPTARHARTHALHTRRASPSCSCRSTARSTWPRCCAASTARCTRAT